MCSSTRPPLQQQNPAPAPTCALCAGEGHKAAKSKVREERVAGISKVRPPGCLLAHHAHTAVLPLGGIAALRCAANG